MFKKPERKELPVFRVAYCENGEPFFTIVEAEDRDAAFKRVEKILRGRNCSVTRVQEVMES